MIIDSFTRIIAEMNNFTIISKLKNDTKEHLKKHILKSILERYNYKPLEHIQEMINIIIDEFEKLFGVSALNYIHSINYTINDKFFEKLKELYINSDNLDFENYDNNFDTPLNRYTLMDWIKFDIKDGVDLMVDRFEDYHKELLFSDTYHQEIEKSLKLYCEYKNKGKKDLEPLTKRETTLITANIIFLFNKVIFSEFKNSIATNYNINNNSPETNQEILNNSYDEIINELKKLEASNEIINLLETEKSIHNNLFTNGKRWSKLKSNNHYMSFLNKCSSVYTNNNLIVFQEFVESLIDGYRQYLEFENKKQKIKSYEQDLEVLKRYNSSNENNKNIQHLKEMIDFLSTAKSHQKFVPFKELSNRLEIDGKQISNYITTALGNGTHRQTIKKIFDSLQTNPGEIYIGKF